MALNAEIRRLNTVTQTKMAAGVETKLRNSVLLALIGPFVRVKCSVRRQDVTEW